MTAGPMRAAGAEFSDNVRHARFLWLVAAGILVAIASIYLPVLQFDFLEYDDKSYVFGNPDIENGLTWDSVTAVFTRSYVSSWHPVAMLSHAFDVSLFGKNPGMHHLMSVLFHAVNGPLVLLVWYRLTGRAVESALLALLWAVHPQHVEPVAWIASRKDLLSTTFLLLCLLAYERYARRGGTARYLFVAVTLLLGLLAKPMLVTLPFILLLLDFWPLNRLTDRANVIRCALEKVPLLLVCIAIAAVTQIVQTEGGAVRSLSEVPLEARLLNVPVAYGNYLVKAVWPTNLSAFYPHPMDNVAWAQVAAGLAAVAVLSAVALWQWRRRPYLFVGWFWFVGSLVPVIGLIQFGAHGMADRYTYVPHLGLMTAAVCAGAEAVRKSPAARKALPAFALLAVLGAVALSSRYVHVFRNDVTLFSHVTAVTRPHMVPWINLGYGYQVYGWYDEALDCYAEAAKFDAKPIQLLRNIAAAHADRGAPHLARDAFAHLLEVYPDDPHAPDHMWSMNQAVAKIESELQAMKRDVELDPTNDSLRKRLAFEYVAIGLTDRAVQLYGGTNSMPPDLAAAVLADKRQFEAAATAFRTAIDHDPHNPELKFGLVRVLHRSSRDASARETLERLIADHPAFTDAVRYKHMLGW